MSEEARFWIGLVVQLAGMAGAVALFLKRAGSGEGRMLGRIDTLNHKIDQANHEIGRTAAAQEKTAEALWRRAETLETRLNSHGEQLAEHRTRIQNLEQTRK